MPVKQSRPDALATNPLAQDAGPKAYPGSEVMSDSSNDALDRQRGQNTSSVTPRLGQVPIPNTIAPSSTRATASNEQVLDMFASFFGSTDFPRFSDPTLLASSLDNLNPTVSDDALSKHVNKNEASANNTVPQNMDESDAERQPSSLANMPRQVEQTQLAFSPSQHEAGASLPFSWDFSGEAVPPVHDNPCRCLESALSVTLNIGNGQIFPHPGAMDLALDVEAQLRESVPLAVQCVSCKGRRGEILKLFSNAMADTVDLLEQLCNIEFSAGPDSFASHRRRTSSTLADFEWLQAKPNGRPLSNSAHPSGGAVHDGQTASQAAAATQGTTIVGTERGMQVANSRTRPIELPSPPKTGHDVLNDHGEAGTDPGGWHMLLGRHLIVGDDRKVVLMHLLRRRLCELSNVLENLIRAMQDLRTYLRRGDSLALSYGDDASNRIAVGVNATAAEIGTRKSMKTAAKLYDVIDHLERVQI
ncbi:MAG: hypothetical protein Q9227_008953 [Pyrenula ochraceoflavens]